MVLPFTAPLILAAGLQCVAVHPAIRKRMAVSFLHFLRQLLKPDAFNARGRPCKILVDDFFVYTDGFKNLSAAIALDG